MVIEGNQGFVTGSQFNNCKIGSVNIAVNMTEVAGDQEPPATYDVVIRKYLQERQHCLLKNAHLLTPPTWNSEFQIDLNHLFTDLVLLKNNRKGKDKKKQPCTLQEFLDVVRTNDSCKILVEGDGGMGKTTLLKHIAHHSTISQNDETFKEKIVFFINVRDIEQGEDMFDAIMKQVNLNDFRRKTKLKLKDKDAIQDFILNHDDEIVLLLDGYDELEASTEDPILSVFKKITLERCKVILTSRSGKIAEFRKSCDVHVKVEGFDQLHSKEFIKRFFAFFNKKKLGKSLIKRMYHTFYNQEEYDYYIFEVCRTPMLLLHICIIWKEKHCLPDNKLDLFKEIFKCIINQFTRSSDDEDKVSEFSDIPSKYKNAMLLLGECMYKKLKHNQLSIAKNELKGTKDEIELSLKLGFVSKDSPISEHHFKIIYTTPHKLLSEALAGFYLCNAVQQGSFSNEEWEEMKCNEYLHNTHVFAIGFLGKDALKLLKNWIPMKDACFCGLAKYFEHVKKEDEGNILVVLDEHLNHFIETRTFTNLSKSLSQFIAYCSSGNKKNFNNWSGYSSSSFFNEYPRRFAYKSKAEPDGNDHFIKLICKITNNKQIFVNDIVDWIQSLSSSENKILGRMVVHASVAFMDHSNILQLILDSIPDLMLVESISSECKKLRFVFRINCLELVHKSITNASFVSLVLHSPKLHTLKLEDCNLTGTLLKEVVDDLCQTGGGVCLSLKFLSLSDNNLSDVSGHTLAQLLKLAPKLKSVHFSKCSLTGYILERFLVECNKMNTDLECSAIQRYHESGNTFEFHSLDLSGTNLSALKMSVLSLIWKVFPKCKYVDMSDCSLSGSSVRALMDECKLKGVTLKYDMIGLQGNDLSDMDSTSLATYLHTSEVFLWNSCYLSADNLHKLINTCHKKGTTIDVCQLNLDKTNLSTISGKTLALIWKVFPGLQFVSMNGCSLSGMIVGEMLIECDRNDIDLKHNLIDLRDNNLSDLNSTSLAHLFNIKKNHSQNLGYFCKYYNLSVDRIQHLICSEFLKISGITEWSDYVKLDRVEDLINECYDCGIELKCTRVNLSGINLSEVSGATLALLWKICPNLKHVDMSSCSLSSRIFLDLLKECENNGTDVKCDMIDISYNNLSDIDAISLCKLLNKGIISSANFWKTYGLTASNLVELIQTCRVCNITCDVDKFNLHGTNFLEYTILNIFFKYQERNLYFNGETLALLWKICPNLKHVDMAYCFLSGRIVSDLLKECENNGIDLKCDMIDISYNKLSDIDAFSLCKLLNKGIISSANVWKTYGLTASNLEELIQTCHTRNITCDVDKLNLNEINLSTIRLKTLALAWQVFPKCKPVDMSKCSLTGRFVADLIGECKRISVDFNINTICLKGSDLSGIDSASLITFIEGMKTISFYGKGSLSSFPWSDYNLTSLNLEELRNLSVSSFSWSEYNLTSHNLEELINFCHPGGRTLKLDVLDLTNVDLAAISGDLLACVAKVFTQSTYFDMRCCKLSSRIVKDLLNEWNELKGNITGSIYNNDFSEVDSTTFALLFKIFPKTHRYLNALNLSHDQMQDLICANFLKASEITNWSDYVKSADKLEELINECYGCSIELKCTEINLSNINLSQINGTTLALLWKICPNLKAVDMRYCSLSGRIVGEVLNDCKENGVDLSVSKIVLTQNDLSDIDSSTLAHLIRIHTPRNNIITYNPSFKLEDYNLSVDAIQHLLCAEFLKISGITKWWNYVKYDDKLHDLIVESDKCGIELDCTEVDLSGIDLDDFNGEILALLWKICPKLKCVKMSNCGVSGKIVRDCLNACDRFGFNLNCEGIRGLRHDDLSDLDSTSLARLLRNTCWPMMETVHTNSTPIQVLLMGNLSLPCEMIQVLINAQFLKISGITKWSDIVLSADKLHVLIDECLSSGIELDCCSISLSGLNLAEVDVNKLALLWKICPYLNFVDMSSCKLSGAIVTKLLKECQEVGVSLKYYMISLTGNNLSDFDHLEFAHFIRIFHNKNIELSQYHISIDDGIHDLICADFFSISKTTDWSVYVNSVDKLHEVIDELVRCGIELDINEVNLEGMNLAEVDVARLALLWKICPELKHVNMKNCNLSFGIVRDLLIECEKNCVNMKRGMIRLCNMWASPVETRNVLKGIDSSTLCMLINLAALNDIEYKYYQTGENACSIWWSGYDLSAKDLQDLLQTCYKSGTKFELDILSLRDTDLSTIRASVLALIWQVIPNCHVCMYDCNLSGKAVGKLLAECKSNGVNLCADMIKLENNDLSDMDCTSLLHFIQIISIDDEYYDNVLKACNLPVGCEGIQHLVSAQFLKVNEINDWQSYIKSADKLEGLINECNSCSLELECTSVNLSGMNLAEVNGATLALLWKICPKLNHVNINHCRLTGRILKDLLAELKILGFQLKGDSISLKGNDLTDIDSNLLCQLLLRVDSCLHWKDYILSARNLIDLTNICYDGNDIMQCNELNLSWVDLTTLSGEILFKLCKISPQLKTLDMSGCQLPIIVVHNFVKLCLKQNVVLALTKLDLSNNDLHDLTVQTLSALFTIFTQLQSLVMKYCEIPGTVVHDFVISFSKCNVVLPLTELDLSGNILHYLTEKSFSALFSICPHLDCLTIEQCKIRSGALLKFVSLCSEANMKLPLTELVLRENNLYSLTGESLGALFSIFNQLDCLDIRVCEIPGMTLHEFVRLCVKDNVVLPLTKLFLGEAYRHSISGKSLALMFSIFPNLKEIDLSFYHLHDSVLLGMADAIHCSYLNLQKMYISYSRFPNDMLSKLKMVFPNCHF